jgi:hypothetical protein
VTTLALSMFSEILAEREVDQLATEVTLSMLSESSLAEATWPNGYSASVVMIKPSCNGNCNETDT